MQCAIVMTRSRRCMTISNAMLSVQVYLSNTEGSVVDMSWEGVRRRPGFGVGSSVDISRDLGGILNICQRLSRCKYIEVEHQIDLAQEVALTARLKSAQCGTDPPESSTSVALRPAGTSRTDRRHLARGCVARRNPSCEHKNGISTRVAHPSALINSAVSYNRRHGQASCEAKGRLNHIQSTQNSNVAILFACCTHEWAMHGHYDSRTDRGEVRWQRAVRSS